MRDKKSVSLDEEDPREVLEEIMAAYKRMSPSAPYELRNRAIQRVASTRSSHSTYTGRWWDDYPDGQIAAFIERVARSLGQPMWIQRGEMLPADSKAG